MDKETPLNFDTENMPLFIPSEVEKKEEVGCLKRVACAETVTWGELLQWLGAMALAIGCLLGIFAASGMFCCF
tara:strand:- start:1210 stop:1428 length:219 start_codon:yes stop_codon:yes gene_type:complete